MINLSKSSKMKKSINLYEEKISVVELLEKQMRKRHTFTQLDIELFKQAKEIESNEKKQLVIGTYVDLKITSPTKSYGMEYLEERAELERDAEKYYNETFKKIQEIPQEKIDKIIAIVDLIRFLM
jgi:hypothetical protein